MEHKGDLEDTRNYLEVNLTADHVSMSTRLTTANFTELMDELLEAYPVPIAPYKVSQDLLKRFFHNLAHGANKVNEGSLYIKGKFAFIFTYYYVQFIHFFLFRCRLKNKHRPQRLHYRFSE